MIKINYNFYDEGMATCETENAKVYDVSDEDKTLYHAHVEHAKIVIAPAIAEKFKDVSSISLFRRHLSRTDIIIPTKDQTKTVASDGSIVYEV